MTIPSARVTTAPERPATVRVGPFDVVDLPRPLLADHIARSVVRVGGTRPFLAFALHVGGLNHRHDADFVAAMAKADVVYADGASVVGLAKLAGAKVIGRSVTTDLGWDVLQGLAKLRGRRLRLALVGGPIGLAGEAGEVLAGRLGGQVVLAEHGFQPDWAPVVNRLRATRPDAIVVGLGAPAEMLWVAGWLDRLPPALVLTCGGWFGFLVGNERRAPEWMRAAGMEWVARFVQAPGRLGPRYARGALSTAALAPSCLRARRSLAG
ncbi:WecB/TagA/CpsF family glycosyltransferase [Fodinicola acaciae]|uniref:WecB/TagA/CpsF family glycosyltransferase n=1 Tax=Fodinicola acaciae TaxID=2681555 RepID=UPI0013D021B4|nr:WecB/TagA/CpsF family glycosyltransferase [Fodinicola acaciae]